MEFSRRQMIAGAGAAVLLAPTAAQAAQAAPAVPAARFAGIAPRLRAFAQAVLARNGFPGVSIALVGPGNWSAALAAGFADLDSVTPATPHQLFQIGSITKSLTGMAIFVLAGRGRLDLDGRVQDLLPDVPMPPEPITVRHLLEHSSGLPNTVEPTPFLNVPGGRLWTGFSPGSRYSYCNLGYTLLGLIIERASGMPFARALETLVLRPIGMTGAKPVIRTSDRPLYAEGHVRLRDDVPWLPRAPLAEARWLEVHTAAGSVAASAHDMVPYLRRIVELGRGKGVPLFSDALAERYRTPTIASTHGPGARYGNGLALLDVGGAPSYRHTGGMIGFSSAMTVDAAAGVGCYASVNVGGAGGYRPIEISEYGLALLRAAAAGRPLPPAPRPQGPRPISEPARFAGRWLGSDGREFTISDRGGALFVSSGGLERPLAAAGDRAVATDHPRLAPYVLTLEPGETPLIRLGGAMFGRGTAPAVPAPDPALAALAGDYYSPGDWDPRTSVYAIGRRLFIDTQEIVQAPDGSWRATDAAIAMERVWFENPIGGRPQIVNVSGSRFHRVG
jgi:CubicO group peptidase (beta-lactamase class C family)